MSFMDFGFDERIQKGIDEAGFVEPTPVQSQSFDLLIKQNRDVYAQSQTGSGKTAAFLLSMFQLRLTNEQYRDSKALIIVPTRELAVQIQDEARKLGHYIDISAGAVFGGGGFASQEKMLKEGLDILVGTPGRLIDFNRQAKINFADYDFLVIDEADRLFDMGFIDDLRKIIKRMKPKIERRTMLFSATLNARVGNLAWEYMNDPGEVIIEPDKVTVDTVIQELYHVGKEEKMKLLLGLLNSEHPANAVIFTNTRHMAWEICKRLKVNGYEKVISMAGDVPQSKRLKIVDELKRGQYQYMVATDVAARGLHVDELQMVINYDVPLEPESYVHRVGRTARAGKSGKTITLACEEFVYGLPPIERLLGSKIPVKWVDDSLIVSDKSEGMRFTSQVRQMELENEKRESATSSKRRQSSFGDKSSRKREDAPTPRQSNKSFSKKPGDRPEPRPEKRRTNHRVTKIQSTVSNVVGRKVVNGEQLKDIEPVSTSKASWSQKSKSGHVRESTSATDRASSTEKKASNNRIPRSKDSKEERLAYYANKYGENFQNQGKGYSSNEKSKKRRQTSQSPSGRKAVANASSGKSPQSRDKRKTGTSGRGERNSSNIEPIPSSKRGKSSVDIPRNQETEKPEKGKGFFRFLFRK